MTTGSDACRPAFLRIFCTRFTISRAVPISCNTRAAQCWWLIAYCTLLTMEPLQQSAYRARAAE